MGEGARPRTQCVGGPGPPGLSTWLGHATHRCEPHSIWINTSMYTCTKRGVHFSHVTGAQNLRDVNPCWWQALPSTQVTKWEAKGSSWIPSAPVSRSKYDVIPLLPISLTCFLCVAKTPAAFSWAAAASHTHAPHGCQSRGAMGSTEPSTSLSCLKLASTQHTLPSGKSPKCT